MTWRVIKGSDLTGFSACFRQGAILGIKTTAMMSFINKSWICKSSDLRSYSVRNMKRFKKKLIIAAIESIQNFTSPVK
jgi:hypothetical protein